MSYECSYKLILHKISMFVAAVSLDDLYLIVKNEDFQDFTVKANSNGLIRYIVGSLKSCPRNLLCSGTPASPSIVSCRRSCLLPINALPFF